MQSRNGQRLPPDAVGVPARLSVNPRARRLSIRIDGRDVRDYDQTTLRQHIGIVLQDAFLFSGTIRH